MASLQYLYIYSNALNGTIPCELGNILHVKELLLYSNQLTGSIPTELGNLQETYLLALFSNSLTGSIPTQFGQFQQMQFLLLDSNCLSGTIPTELRNVKSMEVLFLDSNQFTGVLDGNVISEMSQLLFFGLSGNSVSGVIPTELAILNSALSTIFLDNNLFSGSIPPKLNVCSSIETLDFSNNFLTGGLLEVAELSNLTQIDVSLNFFSQNLPDIFASVLLESVDLSDNYLEGSLGPLLFANCSLLINIDLGNNMLTGTIPGYLFDLQTLVSLNVSNNELSGDLSSGLLHSTGSLQSLDVSSNRLTGTLPSKLFGLTTLRDVLLFRNCFEGSIPATLCSNSSLEYVVADQLTSNCGSGIPKSLQRIFQGSVSKRLMSGSIPDCVWGMSGLKLLQLSGNGLTGTIGDSELENGSSLESLLLSGNQLTGTIPNWIQMSSTLNQLDLSQNRLSWTLSTSLQVSSQPSALFRVSVNRLSGDIPTSFFYATLNITLDVLNGNQFSCSPAGGAAGWGSVFTKENLPSSDSDSQTYVCGSSLLDDYLLLTTVLLLACVILLHSMGCFASFQRAARNCFSALPTVPSIWMKLALVNTALFVLFIGLHNIPALAQFSTHSESYLWMTTAAFLRSWVPVFIILLAVGVSEVTVAKTFDGTSSGDKGFPGGLGILMYTGVHVVNIVVVVATNAGYVYATVNGLSYDQLFVIQFFLGCFKVIWSGTAIPWLLSISTNEENVTAHRAFMSLFAFIGGPFISTFFSASNCFLYVLVQQAPVISMIEVPQYTCSPICGEFCNAKACQFQCLSNCEFQQATSTRTASPIWIYSYQCSSTLLLDYIPVMIASMTVSGILLPSIVLIQFAVRRRVADSPLFNWLARGLVVGRTFDIKRFGRFRRVKTLVNTTVMLTFGFSSPLLGVLVALDAVVWCWMWQVLVSRQTEYLKAQPKELNDAVVMFSELACQALVDSVPSFSDSLMVVSFVGVFWSLFVFDMIGDVYGDLSGGLSMLIPLLMGAVMWLVTKNKESVFPRHKPTVNLVAPTPSPMIELCDDHFMGSPQHSHK